MRAILVLQSGPRAGRSFELRPGQVGQIGSSTLVDFPVADDPALAHAHFLLSCGNKACSLRDLNTPTGTFVDGVKVDRIVLKDGDRITAGRSRFVLRVESEIATPPPPTPTPTPTAVEHSLADRRTRLLGLLRGERDPLYFILDAARAPEALARMRGAGAVHESLYEGEQGQELAPFGPYLVALSREGPLLAELLDAGWGLSWGAYLTCSQPFDDLRRHLRHFLIVRTEAGARLYFRFYDPRVLRVYLPECTPPEAARFFGPIHRIWLEGESATTALAYRHDGPGARVDSYPLDAPASAPPVELSEPSRAGAVAELPIGGAIVVRDAVMQRFQQRALEDFLSREQGRLRTAFPQELAWRPEADQRALLHEGVARAKRFGIQDQRDVQRFLEYVVRFGADFGANPPTRWAGPILNDPSKDGHAKIDAIDEYEQFLLPRS